MLWQNRGHERFQNIYKSVGICIIKYYLKTARVDHGPSKISDQSQ